MALSDYDELVGDLVRDDAGKIDAGDRSTAIARGVERYNQDRPRHGVEDLVAPGAILMDLPVGWEADFSALVSLEYPLGEAPPAYLDPQGWRLYRTPTATKIQIDRPPATGATVRATFTTRHVLTATTDTIPLGHREAVASWASASLLDQLASLYSGDSDSTIQADVVDHASKSRDFAARARAARKRYFDELGLDPKRNDAAGVVVDLDLANSLGRDRLLHPGRLR